MTLKVMYIYVASQRSEQPKHVQLETTMKRLNNYIVGFGFHICVCRSCKRKKNRTIKCGKSIMGVGGGGGESGRLLRVRAHIT